MDATNPLGGQPMNSNVLRESLLDFLGGEEFRKFVVQFRRAGRLRFWQEEAMARFAAAHPDVSYGPEDLRLALRVCEVHGCELLPDTVEVIHGHVDYTTEYSRVSARSFPNANSGPLYTEGASGRDPNVVLQRTNETTRELAVDPATGSPYQVRHVDSFAPAGGDGSVERPYRSLAELQAGSGRHMILFAHAGSGFSDNIVLQPNQRFLAEGIDHLFTATQGTFLLPRATARAGSPFFIGSPGNAITLADNDEVSGFRIFNAGSSGIFGSGVTGFDVNRNSLLYSGTNGIALVNIYGTGRASGNEVSDTAQAPFATGSGITISGSSFAGDVTGNSVFNTANGPSGTGTGISISGATFSGNISGNVTNNNGSGPSGTGTGIRLTETVSFTGKFDNNKSFTNGFVAFGVGTGIDAQVAAFNGSMNGNTVLGNGVGPSGTATGIRLVVTGGGRSIMDAYDNRADGGPVNTFTVTQSGSGVLGINFAKNASISLGALSAFDFRRTGTGVFQVDLGANTGTAGSSTGGVIFAPPGTAFP